MLLHPAPADLPAFLAGTSFDLLARKDNRLIAIKTHDRVPPEGEPMQVAAELGKDYAVTLLEEAVMHLHPRAIQSALVMGWAAFEAAARNVLHPGRAAFAASKTRELAQQLLSRGLLSPKEYQKLLECMYIRNAIVHGVRPDNLSQESISFILALTKRLLQAISHQGITIGGSASVAVLRGQVNQSIKLKPIMDRATEILFELLGPSRESVAFEWDVAEDARGSKVLVLKLSDFTGMVGATFAPSELEDVIHLRSRLNQLWGDLLQIRSHRQVQQLLELTEK